MAATLALALALWWAWVPWADAALEEIEATPTNTNGIELGEISMAQFVLFMLVFLQLVTLYSFGVLPIEIDLGGTLEGLGKRDVSSQTGELSTFLLDCPLQFVCDVDTWAHSDHHQYYAERLVASWFRGSSNSSFFHKRDGDVYGGHGTCREMYPCPFDVQEVVGIRIPGTQHNTIQEEDSYSFF